MNNNDIRWLENNAHECVVLLKYDSCFPFDKKTKIALFGNGARHTLKGGNGSGNVNVNSFVTCEQGLIDAGYEITTKNWLDKYDKIKENQRINFVDEIKNRAKELGVSLFIAGFGKVEKETNYDLPLDFSSDAAIYVLSRISGEGADTKLVEGDSLLTKTEIRDILQLNEKYEKFVLVLNIGRYIDLSPILCVKNIILLGQLGNVTGTVLANIISGKSNPSGRLCETWASPNYYDNFQFGQLNDTNYTEGIYVGYRYFNSLKIKPFFPFGHGLSFTRFNIRILDVNNIKSKFKVVFEVENIGKYKGKEVLQLYMSFPNNNIDRPINELVAFRKSKSLSLQEKEIITIEFNMSDCAYFNEKLHCYMLEKGDYILSLANNSLDLKQIAKINIESDIVCKKVNANLLGKTDFEDLKIVYEKDKVDDNLIVKNLTTKDFVTKKVNYNQNYKINPFIKTLSLDEIINLTLGSYNDYEKLSVIGSSSFHVAGAAGETTNKLINKLNDKYLVMADGPAGLRLSKEYIKTQNGIETIYSKIPEDLEITLEEQFIDKIKKRYLNVNKSNILRHNNTAIPIGMSIAQSWNKKIAEKCGSIVGLEMKECDVDIWLAPAMNIKRIPFCGRNFEYYSEEPLISGIMASSIAKGVSKHNKWVTYKHFLGNNQEFNRYNNNSKISERATREIYLKGFEIAIKLFKPLSIMTSYNLLNGIHTSENKMLLNDILRNELGFDGFVMSDWTTSGLTFIKQSIYPPSYASNHKFAKNDLSMPGNTIDYLDIKSALNQNKITINDLMICASRIYEAILKKYK